MKILRYAQLKNDKGIPYSREHTRRLELNDKFPRRVRLNPSDPRGYCGWIEEEVDAWISARAAEREAVAQ